MVAFPILTTPWLPTHEYVYIYIFIYIHIYWLSYSTKMTASNLSIIHLLSQIKHLHFTRKCSWSPYLGDTLPETNSKKTQKMDGWKMIHLLLGFSLFSGGLLLLVFSGRVSSEWVWAIMCHEKKQKTLSTFHWPPHETKKIKKNSDTFHEILVALIGVHHNSHINWVVFSSPTFIP